MQGPGFVFDKHDTLVFGRAADCHIRMPATDSTVSRPHFILEANPSHAVLRDLGSLNGTWVNGVKQGEHENGGTDAAVLLRRRTISDLAARRRRRACRKDLGRGLPRQVGRIKVRIEADEGEVIALGEDVLVGVVKVQPPRLHGRGHGLDFGTGEIEQGDIALHKQIGDELIEQSQFPAAAQNDADGMKGEVAEGEFRRIEGIQQLLHLRSFGLVEEAFQPDVRVEKIQRESPGLQVFKLPGSQRQLL